MTWLIGTLMIVAGYALMLLDVAAYWAIPLICLAGVAFMAALVLDTRRRHALLVAWLCEVHARVDVSLLDDPDGLHPFHALE